VFVTICIREYANLYTVFLKQSESTLWRLKYFVKEALEVQGKNSGSMGGNENQNNNKRKKEFCDAIAKTKKKTKKTT